MRIYWDLLMGFLKVGCFAFGGAYGAISLIREVVLDYGWITDERLSYFIAVAESTPGPIMANLATYVGLTKGGFIGSLIATGAVIMPSFISILLITRLLRSALKNPWVQAVLRGLKPCIIGIVIATGAFMMLSNVFKAGLGTPVDGKAFLLTLALTAFTLIWRRVKGKDLSSIGLIVISALCGVVLFA